jgi:hypothetical protein
LRYAAAIHHVLGFAALAVAALVFRSARDRPVLERLGRASLPLTVWVVAWQWFVDVAVQPVLRLWGGARLAPAAALGRGYDLYHPQDTGPITGWLYPPGSALAYLPAAWIADPSLAEFAGRCLTLVYYYAPVVWLILTGGAGRGGARWQLLVTFALLTTFSRPLHYASTEIHADAPALGLAALAVVVMGRSTSARGQWLAVGLATLALWAKQLAIPVLAIVLPVWAYRTGGIRGFRQLVLAAGVVSVAVLLLVMTWVDQAALFFNILTVPLRHPRRFDSFTDAYQALTRLYQSHLFLIALLAVGVLGLVVDRPRAEKGQRRSGEWVLFGIVTLAELPFALMAYTKVGGDDNNLAFFFYFLAITCVLLLGRLLDAEGDDPGSRSALLVLAVNLTLALVLHLQLSLALISGNVAWSESKQAERFLRRHAGEAYLPWNPLEHLAVDKRLYHFEYGVYDRDLAGVPLTEGHFRRYIPPHPRLVCYPPKTTVGDRITLRYLPEFTRRVELPELPGWECYAPGEAHGRSAAGGGPG